MPTLPWGWRERAAADLVGRHDELAEIERLIATGAPLVTVVGPAGVGKTTLAARFSQSRGQSPERARILGCELVEARDVDALCSILARALGVSLVHGGKLDGAAQIGAALSSFTGVVVLDSFEQLLPAGADALCTILGHAPELQLLVTSRQRLGVPGERAVELGCLSLPGPNDAIGDSEAGALFLARVQDFDPRRTFTPQERPAVAELLRQLDGLPLAIELAAARCRVLGPAEVLARMDRRFAVLSQHTPGAARARDLRLSIESSWELLRPWEQAALAQCSLFRGSASMDAVEAIIDLSAHPAAPPTLDVVQALSEKSLVRTRAVESAGERRLTLLLSVRDFAREQLKEVESVRSRYLAWYAAGIDREPHPDGKEGLRRLVLDLDNLLHTAALCLERAGRSAADLERAVRILLLLGAPLRVSGQLAEHVALLDRVLGDPRAADLPPELTARALLLRGHFAMRLFELERALEDNADAAARARGGGDERLEGLALARQAGCLYRIGRLRQALEQAERARAVGERTGDAGLTALAHEELGVIDWYTGRLERARHKLDLALESHRARDAVAGQVSTLINLAMVLVELGDLDQARRHAEQGLALHDELGMPLGAMGVPLLFALARIEHAAGRLDQAISRYREVRDTAGAVAEDFRSYAPAYLALARFEQGAVNDASARLAEALPAIEQRGEVPYRAFLRAAFAVVEARLGRHDDAEALLRRSERELEPLRQIPLHRAVTLCRALVDRIGAGAEPAPACGEEPGDVRSLEIRLVRRWLDRAELGRTAAIDGPGHVLLLDASGRWFEPPGGTRVTCSRRPVMRRLLLALAERRRDAPGRCLSTDELLALGWPGEQMLPPSGRLRLHVMLSRMRDLGLREVLQTADEGYRVDPAVSVCFR
jgi:predicted ATPase